MMERPERQARQTHTETDRTETKKKIQKVQMLTSLQYCRWRLVATLLTKLKGIIIFRR